jgi:EmrB/QacA subfamily drug resistance transporter
MSAEEHAFERRWWILGVLCFSLLVIVLDNSILNVAIPTIVRTLHASNSQLQWIVDAYTLVFAGLLLTAGSLGDRFGRRGALQIGFLIFGGGSLLSAMATDASTLILTRAVMGIGGALIMPATLSIITNLFPPDERPRAIAAWAGVAGLGAALGPVTGGFLVEHFYWGSVFLVNLPIVAFGLIAGFFLIPNSKDPHPLALDPFGALLSIVGLVALLYAIIEGPDKGWSAPVIVAGFVAGAILMVAFALWELHIDHPMLDVNFFKNPRFTAASSAITLTFFAMFGSIFLLSQYLQFVLGYSPLSAGTRLLPMAVTMMITAPLSPKLVERVGSKATVASGMTLLTIGLLSMTQLQVHSHYTTILWRLIIIAAGMGLTMAPATDSVMGSLPLAKAGVGSAVNDTTRQVGGAVGVAIIGSVLSSTYGAKVGSFLSGRGVPVQAAHDAKKSIGGAFAVSQQLARLGVPNADRVAADLVRRANAGFVTALHWGVVVAAVATMLGIVVTLVWLPSRSGPARTPEPPVETGVPSAAPV